MITFRREKLTPELFEEVMPLFRDHYDEIVQFQDKELDINIDSYVKMESLEMVRFFTARKGSELVGYSSYFVMFHPHFSTLKQALGDVIYIKPEDRGFGNSFIKWCTEQLRAEGVQRVYQSVNPHHDFGSMLKRQGFEEADTAYTLKLN